jgi:hypothetical protein
VCLVVEGGADRIVHPAVGHQNPQRRQVRTKRHEKCDDHVLDSREPLPPEEEQADEGGLEEKRHQAFNGQRHAEDVADIVRVVRPVGAELEFQRKTGGDAHCKVDAEQLAPELGHVLVDLLAGHHIDRLHDDEQP